jgi:hypothetical protein
MRHLAHAAEPVEQGFRAHWSISLSASATTRSTTRSLGTRLEFGASAVVYIEPDEAT